MMEFFTIRQGFIEEYYDYLNSFNSRLKNMEMGGIEHLFCSPQPIEKTLNDSYEVEVNAKKDKFRVIFFLLWSEKTCYGKLL